MKEAFGDFEGGTQEGDDSMFYLDNLDEDEGGGEQDDVERLDQKNQKLKDQVEEYFDDENGNAYRQPPIAKAPPQPTREELERHQTTHTPYVPWCRHCLAARAV